MSVEPGSPLWSPPSSPTSLTEYIMWDQFFQSQLLFKGKEWNHCKATSLLKMIPIINLL